MQIQKAKEKNLPECPFRHYGTSYFKPYLAHENLRTRMIHLGRQEKNVQLLRNVGISLYGVFEAILWT